ncbi:DNA cytosine methyltransferase [Mesobacillus subterraneus]|uniref:DNA cytosine methyltransferase n=1 Tax=Mesobacillus subterraneus TaxID=285983 RepID=UPI00204145AE|nr:DNA cytosine methyltransferase [Mesobacillus subterraneus]MCM3572280.1 DNA cytosine methyltransferase [Mesobacillus subterraneus]
MESKKKLLAVDLFAGAGGLSHGFLQTGQVQIIAAVENNTSAAKTYERNHPNVKLFGDIKSIDFNEIINECKQLEKDGIDIVFGGPPCQGFSNANRQKTELISTNNNLVKEYVKAIEKLNPKAFVMENVKAMKSSKHKFFFSQVDKGEIVDDLELDLIDEKVVIGRECSLSKELVEFLNESFYIHGTKLKPYILIDKNIFSTIRHLSRKEKEFTIYLSRAKDALKKYFPSWGELHKEYWSDGYKEKWDLFGQLLAQDHLDDIEIVNFKNLLREVIEVQKILMKMNEVQQNNIDIDGIFCERSNIYFKVRTYNVLEYLTAKFQKLGYRINKDKLILNAAEFGAPQTRERLFIIGVKEDLIGSEEVLLPNPLIDNPKNFYKVKHAIQDLESIEPATSSDIDSIKRNIKHPSNPLLEYLFGGSDKIYNHVMTKSTQTALDRFILLEPGQNFHNLDEKHKQTYSNPGRTQNSVYFRLDYEEPSGTVLNVRKSMWVHPSRDRAISIREAARLQTFPDNFVFEGSKDSQYQQIGNAVPPLLGRAVAETVLKYLGRNIEEPLANLMKPIEII